MSPIGRGARTRRQEDPLGRLWYGKENCHAPGACALWAVRNWRLKYLPVILRKRAYLLRFSWSERGVD